MSARNRVIWNEGLFIRPQHFQQQQRYQEYLLEARLDAVAGYLYGIEHIELNPEYLGFGRIALHSAKGVMPDGTVFNIPQEDFMPAALEIPDSSFANEIIYLALPLRTDSLKEVSHNEEDVSRYLLRQFDVRDIHTEQGDFSSIDVSPVRLRLMLERDDRSAFSSLAIAKILEKRPDGGLILDPCFIPCHFNVRGVGPLYRFLTEMSGLVRERSRNIAIRLGSPSQGGVADVSDFMQLQAMNRTQPVLNHLSQLKMLHPEILFRVLVGMCGELFTFTDESRMSPQFPAYDHDMPINCFNILMATMRQALSTVLEPKAVSLQLQKRNYGLTVAPVQDRDLLNNAEFILAVRARMPLEELNKLFVQQIKVASVEKIRELISLQLPGVPLILLPVAPRQLPYHAGYSYFKLERSSSAWEMLTNCSGFAFHVAGDFPELEMQFWAIRS